MATRFPIHLLHDFPDRAHRHLLENCANLRELLTETVPTLTPFLDIDRAELLKRQFEWPDWRRSENDLLFRIPRLDVEGAAAVCVLAEHQSQPDQAIPLRLLGEALLFWFREWRTWQQARDRGQPLRLTLVVPVVFHTGADPWEGPLAFAELFDVAELPAGSSTRIPVWEPALFDLPRRTAESLLGNPGPWHRSLAVVRQIREGTESFAECYQQALRSLIPLRAQDHARWMDFMYVLVSYALQRRPESERQGLFDQGLNVFHDTETREEVSSMSTKVKDVWVERDERIRTESKLSGIQETVLRLGRAKWGPSPEMEEAVLRTTNRERLEALTLRLLTAESWADLMAVPE